MNISAATPFRLDAEAQQSRFALDITRSLNHGTAQLPRDLTERLRAGREQELARARVCRPALAESVARSGGAAVLGGPGSAWAARAMTLLPLILLIAGLFFIQYRHQQSQLTTAIEIDTALLTDDAPLAAYSDAGFVEYLKTPES